MQIFSGPWLKLLTWWFQSIWKILVKLDHLPQGSGWKWKNMFQPPSQLKLLLLFFCIQKKYAKSAFNLAKSSSLETWRSKANHKNGSKQTRYGPVIPTKNRKERKNSFKTAKRGILKDYDYFFPFWDGMGFRIFWKRSYCRFFQLPLKEGAVFKYLRLFQLPY